MITLLATRAPDDTNPGLRAVPAGHDPSTSWLELSIAVDQLTKPERVTIERTHATEDDAKAARQALVNMLYDYRATRARARDDTRLEIERYAAAERANRLAEKIKAHTRERVELPALLVQIRDAVESSTSSGQLGSSVSPAPIGLAAAALLGSIESVVGRRPGVLLIDRVRAWAAGGGGLRTTDPEALHTMAVQAADWVSECRALLNPERRYRPVRDAACPACNRTHAFVVVEGERRRDPALLIDAQTGWTTCRGCGEQWSPERGLWLGQLLAEQRAERGRRRE